MLTYAILNLASLTIGSLLIGGYIGFIVGRVTSPAAQESKGE